MRRQTNSLVCTAAIIKNIHRSTSDRSVIEVDCEPVIDLNSIRKLGNKTHNIWTLTDTLSLLKDVSGCYNNVMPKIILFHLIWSKLVNSWPLFYLIHLYIFMQTHNRYNHQKQLIVSFKWKQTRFSMLMLCSDPFFSKHQFEMQRIGQRIEKSKIIHHDA